MPDFEKPSDKEEEFFAREDIEKKRKLALKQAEETEKHKREELKKLHFMHCPKCGLELQTLSRGKVEIDTCFSCKGIWLDAGELEVLVKEGLGKGGEVIGAVLNLFKRK